MKKLTFVSIVFLLVSFNSFSQSHSGNITSDETWSGTNWITGNVTVLDGVTLTIDPGSTIKISQGTQLEIRGRLHANGTGSDPITFTTNGTPPYNGFWNRIFFNGADSASYLEACIIEYGGGSDGNIVIHNCQDNVEIDDCTIRYSGSDGIYIDDYNAPFSHPFLIDNDIYGNDGIGINFSHGYSGGYLSNCHIHDNGSYPLRIWAEYVRNIGASMEYYGNNPDAIYVDGCNTYTGTWTPQGSVPYMIGSNMTVMDGHTLTLNPGCLLTFGNDVGMEIEGALAADGDPADIITFTSAQSSPTPGYWRYLYFNGADAGTILNNCKVMCGGSTYETNIRIHNSSNNVTITNCEISHGSKRGIYLHDYNTPPSTLNISNSIISDNGAIGVDCSYGTSVLVMSDCQIQNNGSYPIRVWGDYVDNITGTMTITGNTPDAIYVDGDNVYTGAWLNHSVPYVIGGDQDIQNGETLTISPGCELKFASDIRMEIRGTLIADGDAGNLITFTSAESTPAAGDWQCLFFNDAEAGCLLDHCKVMYGGGAYETNIRIHNSGSNVAITNCEISHGSKRGIYLHDYNTPPSTLNISNSMISDNGAIGVDCSYGYSGLIMSDCHFENNGSYPVRIWGNFVDNITGTMTITGNTPDAIYVDGDNVYTGAWLNHSAPYVIGGDQDIQNGETLTINPGCELKFASNIQMEIRGTLVAVGDPGNLITFTSALSTPAPGDWRCLYFNTAEAGSLLDHCKVMYGGSAYETNIRIHNSGSNVTIMNSEISHGSKRGIYLHDYNTPQSNLTISNSIISDNGTYGVDCSSATSGLMMSDCELHNNGSYPIRVWGDYVDNITGTMTFTGNNPDAIYVDDDYINTGTWLNHSVPYVIGGDQDIQNGETLTIRPGCELKFAGNIQMEIRGTLIADGEPGDLITFTSAAATPAPGDWRCLYFNTAEAGSLLDHCKVMYGGSAYETNIRIHNSGSNVTIMNSEISHGSKRGIYLHDYNTPQSNLTISNSIISDNGTYGVDCSSATSGLMMSDCELHNNGSYPIRVWGDYVDNITGTMTFTGNNPDAIYVDDDYINTGTWLNHSVPYVIGGDQDIQNGETLTIRPGCELKFASNIQMEIRGTLIADGEPGNLITFTSAAATPAPGDWRCLYFNDAEAGCLLDHCEVMYAGNSYETNIQIRNSGSNVAITNSLISNGSYRGIYLNDYYTGVSTLTISNSTISDNGTFGVDCSHGYSGLIMSDCQLQNNGSYPISVWGNYVDNITGTMTFGGNNPDAINVIGDNVYDATWYNHGVPYVIAGSQEIQDGSTLTIEAGSELQFNTDVIFEIEGKLKAEGNNVDHINFTSSQSSPAPGDWKYVYMNYADTGTILNYCDFSYGGNQNGLVYVRGSYDNVIIKNSKFSWSATSGVYINDHYAPQSSVMIDNCLIEENTDYGIYCKSSGQQVLSNCMIRNNGSGFYSNYNTHKFEYNNIIMNNTNHGVHLSGNTKVLFGSDLNQWNDIYGNGGYNIYNGSNDIEAFYVYWGATDSAQIASAIYDYYDDNSLGKVLFNPWTNAAHDTLYPSSFYFLDLKLFMEGPFSNGSMSTFLNGLADFPMNQPYNVAPWNYNGSEHITGIPNANIVDWILIELRDAPDASSATGATMVERQAAFVLKDGNVVGMDGSSPLLIIHEIQNNLFVAVRHRNHLDIMSNYPVNVTKDTYSYDFSSGADQVYGGMLGHKELDPDVWGMTGGDGDATGSVNNPDKVDVWAPQAGGSGYLYGDFSLNGQVNNEDKLDVWAPNAGLGTQVPDNVPEGGYSSQVPE